MATLAQIRQAVWIDQTPRTLATGAANPSSTGLQRFSNAFWSNSVRTLTTVGTVTGISVSPSTASGSTTFTATVSGTGTYNATVNWTTDIGTINATTGSFVAPAQSTSTQTGTVTAHSNQPGYTSVVGTASISIAPLGVNGQPSFAPVSGSSVSVGSTVSLSGGNTGSTYYYTITTDGTTPADPTLSSTLYSSPIALNVTGTTKIKAISYKSGVTNSAPALATYTVNPLAPTVTGVVVSPSTATGSTVFTAVVSGTNNPSQTVVWSVVGGGIINSSSGAFTAPAATGSSQTITVKATSTVFGYTTVFGTATVTIAASTGGGGGTGASAAEIAAAVWAFADRIVDLNLSQPILAANAPETVGDSLTAARAQAFGNWRRYGNVLTVYAADGTTVVHRFNLDDPTAPTARTTV